MDLLVFSESLSSSNFSISCWSDERNREAIRSSYFAVSELDIAVRALDSALGNHALRAQPTDYSLTCRYRLVNNL